MSSFPDGKHFYKFHILILEECDGKNLGKIIFMMQVKREIF